MIKRENDEVIQEATHQNKFEELTESIIERLHKNPNLLFIKPCNKRNALIFDLCTRDDFAPLLEKLISRRAVDKDAFVELSQERYPLIIVALAYKAKKNTQILLAAQPDLNITSINPHAVLSKCTPLSLAIENEDPEAVELVLQSYAIQENKFQLPALISQGIVNSSCDMVRLPLMQAVDRICMSNKRDALLQTIKVLLSHKADPNCHDAYGARLGNNKGIFTADTPYELAEARGYQDVMALFDMYSRK